MDDVQQFFYHTGRMMEIQKKNTYKATGEVWFEPDAQYKKKATVCLLVNPATGEWARGVAVCSDKDNFDSKIGRAIALGRAKKALDNQTAYHTSTMRSSISTDSMLPKTIKYKSAFQDIPTALEAKLIAQANARWKKLDKMAVAA